MARWRTVDLTDSAQPEVHDLPGGWEHATTAVVVIDLDQGCVVQANQAAVRLTVAPEAALDGPAGAGHDVEDDVALLLLKIDA